MKQVTASEMRPGNVIAFEGAEDRANLHITIYKVRDGHSYGMRPYIHVNKDVEIGYIGVEEMEFLHDSTHPYTLLEEG